MQQLISVDTEMERNEKGHFIQQESSLNPKTIGLRLHRTHYDDFLAIAKDRGVSSAELARTVIEDWMDAQAKERKSND